MIFSKRLKLSEAVTKWFDDHETDTIPIDRGALGVITALISMGYEVKKTAKN